MEPNIIKNEEAINAVVENAANGNTPKELAIFIGLGMLAGAAGAGAFELCKKYVVKPVMDKIKTAKKDKEESEEATETNDEYEYEFIEVDEELETKEEKKSKKK